MSATSLPALDVASTAAAGAAAAPAVGLASIPEVAPRVAPLAVVTRSATPPLGAAAVGRCVSEFFVGDPSGHHFGTVKAFSPEAQSTSGLVAAFYTVTYEDGDEEVRSEAQLRDILIAVLGMPRGISKMAMEYIEKVQDKVAQGGEDVTIDGLRSLAEALSISSAGTARQLQGRLCKQLTVARKKMKGDIKRSRARHKIARQKFRRKELRKKPRGPRLMQPASSDDDLVASLDTVLTPGGLLASVVDIDNEAALTRSMSAASAMANIPRWLGDQNFDGEIPTGAGALKALWDKHLASARVERLALGRSESTGYDSELLGGYGTTPPGSPVSGGPICAVTTCDKEVHVGADGRVHKYCGVRHALRDKAVTKERYDEIRAASGGHIDYSRRRSHKRSASGSQGSSSAVLKALTRVRARKRPKKRAVTFESPELLLEKDCALCSLPAVTTNKDLALCEDHLNDATDNFLEEVGGDVDTESVAFTRHLVGFQVSMVDAAVPGTSTKKDYDVDMDEDGGASSDETQEMLELQLRNSQDRRLLKLSQANFKALDSNRVLLQQLSAGYNAIKVLTREKTAKSAAATAALKAARKHMAKGTHLVALERNTLVLQSMLYTQGVGLSQMSRGIDIFQSRIVSLRWSDRVQLGLKLANWKPHMDRAIAALRVELKAPGRRDRQSGFAGKSKSSTGGRGVRGARGRGGGRGGRGRGRGRPRSK